MKKVLIISNIFQFIVICVLATLITIMWNNLTPDKKRDNWTYKATEPAWKENGLIYAVGEKKCNTPNVECGCTEEAAEDALQKIEEFTGNYPGYYHYKRTQIVEVTTWTDVGEVKIGKVKYYVYILMETE